MPYAEGDSKGYKQGDVIGCYISLPGGARLAPPSQPLVKWRGMPFYVDEEAKPEKVPGKYLAFPLGRLGRIHASPCLPRVFVDA